jgi:hypothetical protein
MDSTPIDSLYLLFSPSSAWPGCCSGWRVEGSGPEPGASIADVVHFEVQEQGKDIAVPEELLREMDQAGLWARDIIWVCRSPQEAMVRYGSQSITSDASDHDDSPQAIANYQSDINEAREVAFGPTALILGTDDDGGYLVLFDASPLDPAKVEQFKITRRLAPAMLGLEAGL